MNYRPRRVVWEITNACNAKCIHCGSESGPKRENEMGVEDALRVCDELKELETNHVTLIGGECFLSPYWDQVCERLVQNGIRVTPLTNGLLVNDKNIQRMLEVGVRGVAFSIDGIGKTHDYIRGVPGMFDRIIENIKKAQKAGFGVGANTSVSKVNIHELPALYYFLRELGIRVWQVQVVEDIGKAHQNSELKMSLEDLYQVAQYVAEFRKKDGMKVNLGDNVGFYASFEPMLREQPFTGCAAGRWTLGIESTGNVRGCLSVLGTPETTEGNLRERSLIDIWYDPQLFDVYRNRTVEKLEGFCAECEFNHLCRAGCSSLSFALTGGFYENPFCLHKYEVQQGIVKS